MGSFANSLHVKTRDADHGGGVRNRDSRRGRLAADGACSAGGARLANGAIGPSALHLPPRDGWVSILDSDLQGAYELVPPLAKALHAPAIFVLVNDSDSWSYRLADAEGTISEYDSEEDADSGELDDGDLVAAGPAIERLTTLMQEGSFQQKMQELQGADVGQHPPEIRAAEARIKAVWRLPPTYRTIGAGRRKKCRSTSPT